MSFKLHTQTRFELIDKRLGFINTRVPIWLDRGYYRFRTPQEIVVENIKFWTSSGWKFLLGLLSTTLDLDFDQR